MDFIDSTLVLSARTDTSRQAVLKLMLAISTTFVGAGTATASEPLKIIVQKGESLSSIVIRELGSTDPDGWKYVAEFNNQSIDKTLEIGDVLWIPGELLESQQQVSLKEERVIVGSLQPDEQAPTQYPASSPPPSPPAKQTNIVAYNNAECYDQQLCWSVQSAQPESTVAALASTQTVNYSEVPGPDVDTRESSLVQSAQLQPGGTSNTTDTLSDTEKSNEIAESQLPSPTLPTSPKLSEKTTDISIAQRPKEPDLKAAQSEPTATNSTESRSHDSETRTAPTPELPPIAAVDRPQQSQVQAEQVKLPVPTPGLFEVDEDSAVRALERSLIQLNALLLRPGRAEITFSLDYNFDTEFQPVLVTIEDTTDNSITQQATQLENRTDSYTASLDLKFGLPFDSQISLSLPFTTTSQETGFSLFADQSDNQDSSQNGTDDYSITLVKTLLVEKGHRPDILIDATYDGDSGTDGLGSGADELTIGLTATKRQDPLVFTGGLSYTSTLNSQSDFTAGDVTQISIGTLLAASPYTSLQFLLAQAIIQPSELNNQAISGSDTTVATFSAGVSSVVGKDIFLNARLGIGLVERANDYTLSFSLAKQFSL